MMITFKFVKYFSLTCTIFVVAGRITELVLTGTWRQGRQVRQCLTCGNQILKSLSLQN